MGVTVTQYHGPTMRFESAKEYGDWLFSEPENVDHAVDLHEEWDNPNEAEAGIKYLDKRAEFIDEKYGS